MYAIKQTKKQQLVKFCKTSVLQNFRTRFFVIFPGHNVLVTCENRKTNRSIRQLASLLIHTAEHSIGHLVLSRNCRRFLHVTLKGGSRFFNNYYDVRVHVRVTRNEDCSLWTIWWVTWLLLEFPSPCRVTGHSENCVRARACSCVCSSSPKQLGLVEQCVRRLEETGAAPLYQAVVRSSARWCLCVSVWDGGTGIGTAVPLSHRREKRRRKPREECSWIRLLLEP